MSAKFPRGGGGGAFSAISLKRTFPNSPWKEAAFINVRV